MGYRMHLVRKSIYKDDPVYYNWDWWGTKVYGYIEEGILKNLRSYKYLKSLGKIDDLDEYPDFFFASTRSEHIELTHDEFINFISEFGADLIELGLDDGHLFENEDIQRIIDSNENVILYWAE